MSDSTPQRRETVPLPAPSEAATEPAGRRPRRRWRAGRSAGDPPRRTDHALPWLAVLAVLVLACVPMLMGLNETDVVDAAEAEAIEASVQTWRDLDALPQDAGLTPPMPRYNGQPLYERPPALTWLHLIAFAPLERQSATLDDLIFQSRLVSVVFGLLAIAAVFWAGLSIGGMTTAALGALVAAATPAVLASSRLATPDMPQAGAALFGIAAALWAVRPFKPRASLIRQAAGWTLCGLALGAAVLIGGVAIAPKVLLPLAVVLLICPRRVGNLFALAAACCIAALMIAPWAIHVHEQSPIAWRSWFGQLVPPPWTGPVEFTAAAGPRIGWFVLCTLPWTLWLAGALIQPMSSSSTGSRQRMFVGWGWFLSLALLLLLLPPRDAGRRADLLLLLAIAALLVGQVFRQYVDLSDQGRHVRYWSVGRFPQVALMLTLSAAIPMVLAFQDNLVADGWLPGRVVAPMNNLSWIGLAAALIVVAALSMRYALQHHPGRTLTCWSIWVLIAAAVIALPLSRGPRHRSAVKAEARELSRIVGETPVAFVGDDQSTPDPRLLLYTGLIMPHLTQREVDQFAADGEAFYILTPIHQTPPDAAAEEAARGWRAVGTLPASDHRLWHSIAVAGRQPQIAPDGDDAPSAPPAPGALPP